MLRKYQVLFQSTIYLNPLNNSTTTEPKQAHNVNAIKSPQKTGFNEERKYISFVQQNLNKHNMLNNN